MIKNLADFKRLLAGKTIELKSVLFNSQNEIIREQDFAKIGLVQSNAFSLLRKNGESWADFGKAKEWSFDKTQATRFFSNGGRLVFLIKYVECEK